MSIEDRELLSLFLEEAGERLERIQTAPWFTEKEPQSPVSIRRELHALKGASRMMGLTEMAAVCHRANSR